MSDVTVGAKLQIDTGQAVAGIKNSKEAISSLKKELKEAVIEQQHMAKQFGELSKEALAAAKKVASVKDAIKGANEVAELFDPGAKFQAVTGAAAAAANGFSALNGIMALTGSQSDAVEQSILKIQAAMALSDGLSMLADSKKEFERLGAMIKQTTLFRKADEIVTKTAAVAQKLFGASVDATSAGFGRMKMAIAATGIGALIVAIGFLLPKIMEWVSGTDDAEAAQRRLNDAIEAQQELLKEELAGIDYNTKVQTLRAKLAGKSEAELTKIQQEGNSDRLQRLKENSEALDKLAANDDVKYEDKKKNLKAARDAFQQYQNEILKQRADELQSQVDKNDKLKADQKKANDEADQKNKQRVESEKRKVQELKAQHDQEVNQARQLNAQLGKENTINAYAGKSSELRALEFEFQEKMAIIRKAGEEELTLNRWFENQKAEIDKKYKEEEVGRSILTRTDITRTNAVTQADLTASNKANAEERKRDAEEEAKARVGFAKDIGGAMGALSELIGKETAAGKAMGVAQAGINTWIGVTEVLRAKSILPEPMGTIAKIANVAAVVASGLTAVKNILKVQVPKGGGGGSQGVNTSATAALAPLAPRGSATSLDQDTINSIGNASANRSFVLTSDVNSQQEKLTRLNRAARLN